MHTSCPVNKTIQYVFPHADDLPAVLCTEALSHGPMYLARFCLPEVVDTNEFITIPIVNKMPGIWLMYLLAHKMV